MALDDLRTSTLHLRVVSAHLQDAFNTVTFSPDGRRLASGSDDSAVRIWDAGTGKLLRTLAGHHARVSAVSWSADGTALASASADNTVRIWDTHTGKLLRTIEGHSDAVSSVTWSADGKALASASEDNTVRIWDANTGKQLHTLEGHRDAVSSVTWSADREALAGASRDRTVRIWATGTGKLLRTLEGHRDAVNHVSWSADGKAIASASEDGTVRIWDANTGKPSYTLEGHGEAVSSVSWSADGKSLASASEDNTVRIWDVGTGELSRTLEGHGDVVTSVSWSADGKAIASASHDRTLRIWDPRSRKVSLKVAGHDSWVTCVSWSANGKALASASYGATVRIWDASTGKLLRTLEGHGSWVTCLSWSPDGKALANSMYDTAVRIWDAGTGMLIRTLEGHGSWVTCVSWSPDGKTLASASDDSTVRIWDAGTGKLLRMLKGHGARVSAVSWSEDGKTLASASADNTVRTWDAGTGKPLRTLEGHHDTVNGVSWSKDGKALASASADRTVRIWDTGTGKLVRALEGHGARVTTVSWSEDGKALVSASEDNRVWIWNPASGTGFIVRDILRPTYNLIDVGFGNEASLRASCGATHLGDPELIVATIERLAGEAFTRATSHVTSAKIVLVGESNVGKSYLAHRIVTGKAPDAGAIKSTHGMMFWPLAAEQLHPSAKAPAGERREVVLWDMGGQEEYRLIHQLFLHDTTVALLLLDPTRGTAAFQEIEAWARYLENQLHGRTAVKLLVGAKLDQPSDKIDRQALGRLRDQEGFKTFLETSALTGRGMTELGEAVAEAIDWEGLGKTSRPELFQRILDEIETRRQRGDLILHVADLHRALSAEPPSQDQLDSVRTVTEQLAVQGAIACSRVATGEPVLVLQVQEIERYAGSLILAARNNPRSVPALELRAIGSSAFSPPEIPLEERLPPLQERSVLECTVQLLLEHGICFEHEGLLVFPSLFASGPAAPASAAQLPHTISLYYDFSGAIDNIYASLVAWLVLAKDFGNVRLWPDRAEFEVKDTGLCGLRKVSRPGGFAHVDIYFDTNTPVTLRERFITFVEDHLSKNGIQISECLVVSCPKEFQFDENTLRMRLAEGARDVLCPRCETRHPLGEGATEVRKRDPQVLQRTWALKTLIEKLRKGVTRHAVQSLRGPSNDQPATGPIRVLHLSDLHFHKATSVQTRLQWLLDDLKLPSGLGCEKLDYLVVSGDFTDKGCSEGFEKAQEFLSGLINAFGLSAERCILVPGNHDVASPDEAYVRRRDSVGLGEGEWFQEGRIILARHPQNYPLRFKPYSDCLYHKLLQRPYPTEPAEQGVSTPFWDTGIQFLTFNSCWEIDEFYPRRAGLHPDAVAKAIAQAQRQVEDAREAGHLAPDKPLLRIAVWHHAVTAPDFKMKDLEFLTNLQKNQVRLALHGDVHQMRREIIGYWHDRRMHIAASGSFGARGTDRPESIPRLYNLLEIARDLNSIRVHTRRQLSPDGAWDGWKEWPDPSNPRGGLPYYDIHFDAPMV